VSQSNQVKWQCDICKRTTHTDSSKIATGWRRMKFYHAEQDAEPASYDDVCDSCTSAIVGVLSTRKRAEKGRHIEPEPQQHPPTPAQADAIARFNLRKSS